MVYHLYLPYLESSFDSSSSWDGVRADVGKFVRVGRKEIVGNFVLVGYLLKRIKITYIDIINIHFIKLTM